MLRHVRLDVQCVAFGVKPARKVKCQRFIGAAAQFGGDLPNRNGVLVHYAVKALVSQAPSATLTYGMVQVFPGMQNVIADRVNLSIDMRDGSEEELLQDEVILKRALEFIERKGFRTRLRQNHCLASAQMDPNVIRVIEQHCEEKHLAYKHMNSGAGHDSMVFGKHFPTAMIFVPSIGGISHNPAEATAAADIQTGFELLCDVLKELSE